MSLRRRLACVRLLNLIFILLAMACLHGGVTGRQAEQAAKRLFGFSILYLLRAVCRASRSSTRLVQVWRGVSIKWWRGQ